MQSAGRTSGSAAGPVAPPAWVALAAEPDAPLKALAEPTTADVAVIGLGASGLAACVLLAGRGAEVIGLDAVGVGAGAAGANGGFLLAGTAAFHHRARAQHGAEALAWYQASLDELDRVFAEEPSARRVGSLRIAASAREAEDIAGHLAALRADGLPAEPYDGPEGVGLLLPSDGVFQPLDRCRRLAARARALGARLHAPARVTAVAPGRVEVGGLVVRAARVLVAVDGGLDRLVLGLDVRTARLQMLATAPTTEVALARPVYRRDGYDYYQQLPSGEVLLGGGRDLVLADEWDAPAVPSPAVQEHLDRELERLGVTAAVTHRWAAHAAFAPDGLPVITKVADGVAVVGAYSGHGNVLGTLLARQVAAALLDGRPVSSARPGATSG